MLLLCAVVVRWCSLCALLVGSCVLRFVVIGCWWGLVLSCAIGDCGYWCYLFVDACRCCWWSLLFFWLSCVVWCLFVCVNVSCRCCLLLFVGVDVRWRCLSLRVYRCCLMCVVDVCRCGVLLWSVVVVYCCELLIVAVSV